MSDILTPDEVDEMVNAMRPVLSARDYKKARRMERDIWEVTLQAIADGIWDTKDLATSALSTRGYKFPRDE